MRAQHLIPAILCSALLVVVSGCGSRSDEASIDSAPQHAPANVEAPPHAPNSDPETVRINFLTPQDAGRITDGEAAAIQAIGASHAGPPAGGAHAMSDMGNMDGMNMEQPLSAGDTAVFGRQWAAAQAAVAKFDTVAKAAALGYVRAATPENGIGTHWVSWEQIAKPFDPAHPAMLLFDERKSPAVLVGFAYWLQSATKPVGFAGDNDVWHQHTGLCVVNGWLDREESVGHEDCAGTLFQGGDLWMLHAWVVDRYKNRDGNFAVFNPFLCPSRIGTPDDLLCPH